MVSGPPLYLNFDLHVLRTFFKLPSSFQNGTSHLHYSDSCTRLIALIETGAYVHTVYYPHFARKKQMRVTEINVTMEQTASSI